jgi:RND family efflux transporter MFP subunit
MAARRHPLRTIGLAGLALALASVAAPAIAEEDRRAVRGLVAAQKEAALSSELTITVLRVHVDTGSSFAKDAVLIEFDCAVHKARLTMAEATLSSARAQLQAKERLLRLQSVGQLEVEIAKAEAMKAAGQVAEIRAIVERCVVLAPYDGRVAKRHINAHEVAQANKPLLDIVAAGPLRVTMIVPSQWLGWLKAGAPFALAVEETGRSYTGAISSISARVDAVSRSIEIIGEIGGSHPELLPGMSGSAQFPRE